MALIESDVDKFFNYAYTIFKNRFSTCNIAIKQYNQHKSLEVLMHDKTCHFDVKFVSSWHRNSGNFSIPKVRGNIANIKFKDSYFLFVDTSNAGFGHIYAVSKEKLYNFIQSTKIPDQGGFFLISKSYIIHASEKYFNVNPSESSISKLKVLTGISLDKSLQLF